MGRMKDRMLRGELFMGDEADLLADYQGRGTSGWVPV